MRKRSAMKLTKPQRRALKVLRDKGPTTSGGFGPMMWPNSQARLTGLNRPAGQMLNRLRSMGLVNTRLDSEGWAYYSPSVKGLQALEER